MKSNGQKLKEMVDAAFNSEDIQGLVYDEVHEKVKRVGYAVNLKQEELIRLAKKKDYRILEVNDLYRKKGFPKAYIITGIGEVAPFPDYVSNLEKSLIALVKENTKLSKKRGFWDYMVLAFKSLSWRSDGKTE